MALNSFSKHCSNVLSALLRFVCNKNLWEGFPFLSQNKAQTADKTLEKCFLDEIILRSHAKTPVNLC